MFLGIKFYPHYLFIYIYICSMVKIVVKCNAIISEQFFSMKKMRAVKGWNGVEDNVALCIKAFLIGS